MEIPSDFKHVTHTSRMIGHFVTLCVPQQKCLNGINYTVYILGRETMPRKSVCFSQTSVF